MTDTLPPLLTNADRHSSPTPKILLAKIARAARSAVEQDFRDFVSAILAGRFVSRREVVASAPVGANSLLKATDRDYVMMPNGSYRRVTPKRSFERDRSQSNIFCPHWPSKNKYDGHGRRVGS